MGGRIGVGIDVGGTKILLVALDTERGVVGEVRVDSPGDLPRLREAIAPALVELAATVASDTNIALGAALPGLVDVTGTLRGAPNLGANAGTYDLHAELATPLLAALGEHAAPVPVALANDSTAAAFAEVRLGAARGYDDVISISVGTGIGAGVVIGGRPAAGSARGYAGEIGHMLVDPNGPICGCGRRGCWEATASGSALGRLAADAGFGPGGDHVVRGEEVVAAARNGERTAEMVIHRYAHLVAVGLVNACELLDPAVIVLGGGIITAADVLLEPIRDAFVEISRPAQERRREDLVPARLGPQAAAIGAALLALESERA